MATEKEPKEPKEKEPKSAISKAGKALSVKGAAKGGRARASVLTAEERKNIARQAAATRWEGKGGALNPVVSNDEIEAATPLDTGPEKTVTLPRDLFRGKVQMADTEIECYVLDNGKRVIAQREVVRLLTSRDSGNLVRYLEAQNLQNYINPSDINKQVVQFSVTGTQFVSNGYEATLLLDICDAYLRARDDDALLSNQTRIAKQAEIITRSCAKIGIIALIDEATGYDKFKKKRDYQIKLQAFIADDMQEWAKMFPDEFWFELARLEGIHYSPRSRPLRWGRYVMMFVYDAIDGDIGNELRKKNPQPHFSKNHHQWLKQFGRDKVHDQITQVVTIMKLCQDMKDFREKFARVFKKTAIQTSFDDLGWM